MQHANNQQDEQAPQKHGQESGSPGLGPRHLHGHPPPEQEGEQGVELGLHQEANQNHHSPINYGQGQGIVISSRLPTKAVHVHEQNAEQGKAAQDVNEFDALFGLDRGGSRWSLGDNRLKLGHKFFQPYGAGQVQRTF